MQFSLWPIPADRVLFRLGYMCLTGQRPAILILITNQVILYQYNLYFSSAHFSSKCNTIRHSLLHLFLPALGRVLKEGHNSSIFKILAQKLVEIFCMHSRLILYIMCPYLAQSYAYSLLLKNVNKEHLIIKWFQNLLLLQ